MDEVKPLIHQRGQVRAKVTAILKQLEKAENDLSQILSVIPSSKLDDQDEKVVEFDLIHTDALMRVECLIDKVSKPCMPSSSAVAPIPSTSFAQPAQVIVQQQPLKAPIPTFNGEYENWPRFKALFSDIIGRCTDSDAIKLHHLDKALIGAAAGIIDSRILVENNYNHAWEILVERFENKRVIVDTHLSGLLTMKKMVKESHTELRALIETCSRHIEGLKFLDQPVDGTAGLFINKLLTSCLDPVTRKQWERTLKHDQCRVLERCETDNPPASNVKSLPNTPKTARLKVHTTSTLSTIRSCHFCSKDHLNYQCPDFRNMSLSERLLKVKESRVCYNCLRRGHRSGDCSSKGSCAKCRKRHHTLLHDESKQPNVSSKQSQNNPISQSEPVKGSMNVISQPVKNVNVDEFVQTQTVSSSCSVNLGKTTLPNVLLLTAVVNLMDQHGQSIACRALLDCGAQTNLLSSAMYQKLGLKGEAANFDIVGVGNGRSNASCLVQVLQDISIRAGDDVRDSEKYAKIRQPYETRAFEDSRSISKLPASASNVHRTF
ncbi:uncharacterized protein LOC128746159 [Sabethes cyaneus]|uniref:uncharacterized protein LOC128746159 n=1 Tax=Sabethes cyaneus TaxID=53552 RepID=UPI00237E5F36|nr:uncharacterized protein LOC128746159 [Sabethes cyaneus]